MRFFLGVFLSLFTFLFLIGISSADTFRYSIKNPKDEQAQKYIETVSGIELIDEGDLLYWQPKKGGATEEETDPGILIFHFPFSEPVVSGKLFVYAAVFHWKYSQGHSIISLSTDGKEWHQVAEGLPPEYGKYNSGDFSGDLPSYLAGSKDIYIKIELYSYGPSAHRGGAMTNTAQTLRYSKKSDNTVLSIEVQTQPPQAQPPEKKLLTFVTENGTDVTLDWTPMPDADRYVLYYAFPDYKGEIDLDTVGSVDVGTDKTFEAKGLPGGIHLFTAVVGYADSGNTVSNIEEVFTFDGKVSSSEEDGILIELTGSSEVEKLTVSGTFDEKTSEYQVYSISGVCELRNFRLLVEGDRPSVLVMGQQKISFTYLPDGSVKAEQVQTEPSKSLRKRASVSVDCAKYDKTDDGMSNWMDDSQSEIKEKVKRAVQNHPLYHMEQLLLAAICAIGREAYLQDPIRYSRHLLRQHCSIELAEVLPKARKIIQLVELIDMALEPVYHEILSDVTREYEDAYLDQCDPHPDDNGSSNNQQGSTGSDNPEYPEAIAVTNACPLPDGAECHDSYQDGVLKESYCKTIHGLTVGPLRIYMIENESPWLRVESRYNQQGHEHGWTIGYNRNGSMQYAHHYVDGVMDGYSYWYYADSFDQDGNQRVYINDLYSNGKRTHRWVYDQDGSISQECINSDGRPDGSWTKCLYYNKDGSILECTYPNGEPPDCTTY